MAEALVAEAALEVARPRAAPRVLLQHLLIRENLKHEGTSVRLVRGPPSGQKIVAGTDLLQSPISDEAKVVSKNCILQFLMKPKWFHKLCQN